MPAADCAPAALNRHAYRPAQFQETVPFGTYVPKMEESMSGWELRQVKLLGVRKIGSRALVEMRFVESYDENVAKQRFGGRVSSGEVTSEGTAVWNFVRGRWTCIDAVSRGHIALNGVLVQ